jgi:hypothetical protein
VQQDFSDPSTLEDILHCVHEYVVTLYGALCARYGQPLNRSGFQPPCSPFDLCFYSESLQVNQSNPPYFLSLLAAFGFDLLDNLIKSHKSTLLRTMAQFNNEIKFRHPDTQPGQLISPITYQKTRSPLLNNDMK